VIDLHALALLVPSDPGQGIFDTSQQLGGLVDDGLAIIDYAKKEPFVAIPTIFGPMMLISWAFRRSRKESSNGDWTTRG
jgi:hypothetical protein